MKKAISIILKVGISVLIFYVVFQKIDTKSFLASIKDINFIFFPWIIFLAILNRIIMAAKMNLLLKIRGYGIGLLSTIRIVFLSGFFGLIIPTGVAVDVIQFFYIKNRINTITESASVIIADRVIGLLVLSGGSAISLIWAWERIDNAEVGISIIILFCSVCIGTGIIMVKMPLKLIEWILPNFLIKIFGEKLKILNVGANFLKKINEAQLALREIFKNPISILKVFVLAILILVTRIGIIHYLFLSLGTVVPIRYEAVFVPIIIFLILLPISFLGLGVKEGAFVFFFGLVGIKSETAMAASLLTYCVQLTVIILGGLVCLLPWRKEIVSEKASRGQPNQIV